MSTWAGMSGLQYIAQYTEAVADVFAPGNLYRGHADANWSLVPSAFRPGNYGLEDEAALSRWKQVAARLASPKPTDNLEYLVLAQHYGISTALLDWTSNPLMALFFACLDSGSGAPGNVVKVGQGLFNHVEHTSSVDVFANGRSQPILFEASAMNMRSTAQDSLMTLHTRSEEPLPSVVVYQIGPLEKWRVLDALSLFGLTPERVYADLAVAASRLGQELRAAGEHIAARQQFALEK